ncbi:protein adenylyltransferase Fic [Caerostris darwini]|uniref:Protein adenylyltransferase Fic n=1 Tax=Caerostris darwini TaxID=1538125 RepID=A0AAV4PFA9_9ARAC|nr:protein adenylyltransferase Fic [Caerostris darwini]
MSISMPEQNETSEVSVNTSVTKKCSPKSDSPTNTAVSRTQKYNDLTAIPNFLPDSNEAEEPVYLDERIAIPNLKYKNHGTEEEALKVLQLAIKFKNSSKLEKAKKLFEHALSLQPLQPDVINSYAEFLEEHANDLITADHLYVKTLTLCPNHSKALINRNRTMSIVELMDEQEFVKIDKKRNDLINRNHNESFMKHIKKEVYFLHIHHTVAIEGNTMSLAETRKVVETKLVIPGKSIREHNEILGLDSALRFMNQTYVNHSRPLSLFDILQIHKRVLGHVDPISAGSLRESQVFVGEYVPPPASEVEFLMEQFVDWFKMENMTHLHPVKKAALAHYKFIHIHPFMDGNGRTARLLMNLVLMRAGYPPVIIWKKDRSVYFEMLQIANEGDIRPFIRFIVSCTEYILDVFLNDGEYDTTYLKALHSEMACQTDLIPL